MSTVADFGVRLDETFSHYGHLCVGIDPHPYLFDRWNVDDTPHGIREFCYRVLDACGERVGIIKPQVAFFERWGASGYEVLASLMARARGAGILVIADGKRGDIGSTMEAYASSWLSVGSLLEADALTVSPYLGVGALEGTFRIAQEAGKGVFVLAATSNPEARGIQSSVVTTSDVAGESVAAAVVNRARDFNVRSQSITAGVVLGATVDLANLGIASDDDSGIPVLAPGFGFQGAETSQAAAIFGSLVQRLVVTETRSILEAGPDAIVDTIQRKVDSLGQALE